MSLQSMPNRTNAQRDEADAMPRLSSHELLKGVKRVIIDHEGTEYTLHLTRQNKLLLTK